MGKPPDLQARQIQLMRIPQRTGSRMLPQLAQGLSERLHEIERNSLDGLGPIALRDRTGILPGDGAEANGFRAHAAPPQSHLELPPLHRSVTVRLPEKATAFGRRSSRASRACDTPSFTTSKIASAQA